MQSRGVVDNDDDKGCLFSLSLSFFFMGLWRAGENGGEQVRRRGYCCRRRPGFLVCHQTTDVMQSQREKEREREDWQKQLKKVIDIRERGHTALDEQKKSPQKPFRRLGKNNNALGPNASI